MGQELAQVRHKSVEGGDARMGLGCSERDLLDHDPEDPPGVHRRDEEDDVYEVERPLGEDVERDAESVPEREESWSVQSGTYTAVLVEESNRKGGKTPRRRTIDP